MLARVNLLIDRCAEWAVIVTFMAIALVGGLQVFCRFILNLPLQWGEEVQIYGHVWIVFLTVARRCWMSSCKEASSCDNDQSDMTHLVVGIYESGNLGPNKARQAFNASPLRPLRV